MHTTHLGRLGVRWREIDELPAPALQKEYAILDLPKVAETFG